MKAAVLLLALFALGSCGAFTAPKDPVTGIRQDAPAGWTDTPNPLDEPEGAPVWKPESEGHFGHSNKGVTW